MSRCLLSARGRSNNTGVKQGRGNDAEGEVGEGSVASLISYICFYMIVFSANVALVRLRDCGFQDELVIQG